MRSPRQGVCHRDRSGIVRMIEVWFCHGPSPSAQPFRYLSQFYCVWLRGIVFVVFGFVWLCLLCVLCLVVFVVCVIFGCIWLRGVVFVVFGWLRGVVYGGRKPNRRMKYGGP